MSEGTIRPGMRVSGSLILEPIEVLAVVSFDGGREVFLA